MPVNNGSDHDCSTCHRERCTCYIFWKRVTLTFPARTEVPVVHFLKEGSEEATGSWEKLPDGSIQVTFTPMELKAAIWLARDLGLAERGESASPGERAVDGMRKRPEPAVQGRMQLPYSHMVDV